MRITNSFIVSFDLESTPDKNEDKDTAIAIVGKRDKKDVTKIVNAFQGEEAIDLYRKLTEKKTMEVGD